MRTANSLLYSISLGVDRVDETNTNCGVSVATSLIGESSSVELSRTCLLHLTLVYLTTQLLTLVCLTSGPSNEQIDILTKYQSLSLREPKYRDMNGYSRYGLYKLYHQSQHSVVVICQSQQLSASPYPSPLFLTSCSLLQPDTIPPFTHDFKHSNCLILTGLSLIHC